MYYAFILTLSNRPSTKTYEELVKSFHLEFYVYRFITESHLNNSSQTIAAQCCTVKSFASDNWYVQFLLTMFSNELHLDGDS